MEQSRIEAEREAMLDDWAGLTSSIFAGDANIVPENTDLQLSAQDHSMIVQEPLKRAIFFRSRGRLGLSLQAAEEVLSEYPYHVDALIQKGITLLEMKDWTAGHKCFTSVLMTQRKNYSAIFYLGRYRAAIGELGPACQLFQECLQLLEPLEPREAELAGKNTGVTVARCREGLAVVLTDLATMFKIENKAVLDEYVTYAMNARRGSGIGIPTGLLRVVNQCIRKYLGALDVCPNHAPAHYNLGVLRAEIGYTEGAMDSYHQAVRFKPDYYQAFSNIGVLHRNEGRLEQAIVFYKKALAIEPNFAIAANNLAVALTDLGTQFKNNGDTATGIRMYKEALTYNIHYADGYYNLGVGHGEQRKLRKAIYYYELALSFNPACCEAYNNLGVLYKDLDNYARSIQCYQKALEINPEFAQSCNNLAVVYTVQGKIEEAHEMLSQAIKVNENYADAYNNLGVLLRDEGRIRDSLEAYRKSLSIDNTSVNAGQNCLLALNYRLENSVEAVTKEHLEWGRRFERFVNGGVLPPRPPLRKRKPGSPLRVGYLSSDLFTHSVSYFTEALLKFHGVAESFLPPSSDERPPPSEPVELVVYSTVARPDSRTHYLKQLGRDRHVWHDCQGLSPDALAELVRKDDIDILVELGGHTAGNRLEVLARRPAPLQVTYIGYPNTTGMDSIDYRITDGYADPEDTRQVFSERLVRMPECFLCYTPSDDANKTPSAPPALSLGHITFGSFNNIGKLDDKVLNTWARILGRVPDSRLILKSKAFASESVAAQYLKKFADLGIAAYRIDLLGLMSNTEDHLNAYSMMDISLDTFPYCGTTTTCEALWMGVPVVTLRGHSHVHNVGASLLSQVGCQAMIASDVEDYVDKAVELVSNLDTLTEIRRSLRQVMESSCLMQGPRFVRDLETAYRAMWSHLRLGGAPTTLPRIFPPCKS